MAPGLGFIRSDGTEAVPPTGNLPPNAFYAAMNMVAHLPAPLFNKALAQIPDAVKDWSPRVSVGPDAVPLKDLRHGLIWRSTLLRGVSVGGGLVAANIEDEAVVKSFANSCRNKAVQALVSLKSALVDEHRLLWRTASSQT